VEQKIFSINKMRPIILFFRRVARLIDPRVARLDLSYILSQAVEQKTLPQKIVWVEDLIGWVRSGASTQMPHEFDVSKGEVQTVRIRFLIHLLERHPLWKSSAAHNLRAIIKETSGLRLFCLAGISQESGFLSEALNRFFKKILPEPPQFDLSELFLHVFDDESDPLWIKHLTPETIKQIESLFKYESSSLEDIFTNLRQSMFEALIILSSRVCAMGLSEEIRQRLSARPIFEVSFFKLQKKIEELVESNDQLLFIDCQSEIESCRKDVQEVFMHLEVSGVSTQIVYRLESLSSSLNRIEIILCLLAVRIETENTREALIPRFLSELTRDNLSNRSIKNLANSTLHLLARKIVERTGESGEHYIARDRTEYIQMLKSASGGGLLTVITTLIKFVILRLKFALFFEGFFHWINYSASFLAMQFAGFTLATKQPSMTASSLAGKLAHLQNASEIEEFVDEVARITRSQSAAALGNIGAVIPGAIIFDLLFKLIFGHHVLNEDLSHHYVESFNPFTTWTIAHACLTGVILWVSSVAGGWTENWVVFHQIPLALEKHRRLVTVFGEHRCKQISKWLIKNVSGFGSNVVLGFFLAFTPSVGRIFGLPLEAKHVTLSTGALTFALCSLWARPFDAKAITLACLGLVIIGLLNFTVSFTLALVVALRAREIEEGRSQIIWKAIRARLRKKTTQFFFKFG
jgi:site-specific recombinase